jgi:hypothetical protein
VLIDRANLMLDAWDDGLITDEAVRSWAGTELLAIVDSRQVPVWLLDLVQYGPHALTDVGLEWRRASGFGLRFALRATRLDLQERSEVEAFVRWLGRAAMGQELSDPEVRLGYQVEHCLDDLGRIDLAVECVRNELPALVERCRATIAASLGQSWPARRSK